MSARSYLGGILHVLLAAALTRELDSQAPSDSSQTSERFPAFLPLSYELHGADYVLLKEAGQDIMSNSSLQSQTQLLAVLRAHRPPVVTVSLGSFSTEGEIPLGMIQSVSLFPLFAPDSKFIWKIHFFVVSRQVRLSNPKVCVLFYVPGRELYRETMREWAEDELPCVTVYVYAFWETQEVRGTCVISSKSGLCVATLDPPAQWFGPAHANQLELYYQTKLDISNICNGKQLPNVKYDPVTPMQRIGSVRLLQVTPGTAPVSFLRLGDAVIIQTSSKVVQKNDIASFLVFVKALADLDYFSLRVAVREGLTFRKATPTDLLLWDVTLGAASTDQVVVICKKQSSTSEKRLNKPQAILRMDFEVEKVTGLSEVQVIKWELLLPDEVQMQRTSSEGFMEIYTSQKDFVGLAALVMEAELLNTAVLTGRRATVPVRIVAVETDGSVSDVTDFTNCNSTDEDVLKVSGKCDYVYVNGRETKGRVPMLVNFTYSYMSTQLEMKVWFPRFPLDIDVSDTVLNPIKGWRIPIHSKKSSKLGQSSEEKGRGCTTQYQHALVRVLTHFTADQSDPHAPQAYFLGSDWLVDVTKMVQRFMKVEDPSIARLQDGRVLIGQNVGTTCIKVLSPLSDSILAEKSVSVVDERVTIAELGLQLVSGLTLRLQLSTGSNRAISATATTQEVLNAPKQKAALCSWLQFSDRSTTPLDIYDSTRYLLNLTSLDEAVVSVRDSPQVVEAEGEGRGALIRAEMSILEACQKKNRKSLLAVGNGDVTVKFTNNQSSSNSSVEMMGTGEAHGMENEEQIKDMKEIPKLMSSSSSEREESALRNITTTVTSSQASDERSISADMATRTNSDASAGFSQAWNIFYKARPLRPTGNSSAENLDRPNEENLPESFRNFNNSADEVEGPVQQPKNSSEEPLPHRPLTHLEIGMYALLSVFCLAILLFFFNCILHLVRFLQKHRSFPSVDQTGHDWMWLQTDGQELIQTETQSGGIGIGPKHEPHGAPAVRVRCQLASVSTDLKCGGFERSESAHSPTSKRKRVQFTTFALMECSNSPGTIPRENGHGVQGVGKEEAPDVPRSEELEEL